VTASHHSLVMTVKPELAANARYLFDQVEPGLDLRPLHETVARAARPIRELVRKWWEALEPEATAGVSPRMMEAALAKIAAKAVESSSRTVSRRFAAGALLAKSISLQTDAEDAIGRRFVAACERLGVLAWRGTAVSFAHPSLLDIYLGVGMLAAPEIPLDVRQQPRLSLLPLQWPRGRAVLALLALLEPEPADQLFVHVAAENLHLATWFLYYDEAARQRRGEWLATEILNAIQWDVDTPAIEALERCLDSLGASAVAAARGFIDAREGGLPGYVAAVKLLAYHGSGADVSRLQALLAEPAPGDWEIARLRRMIRHAESLVLDDDAQKRYGEEEKVEIAKETVAALIQIAGIVLARGSKATSQQWLGTGLQTAGGIMADTSGSAFFRQQAALRQELAQLPPLIERRKVQIQAMAPYFRQLCESAAAHLSTQRQ
jgi:hypothetical protein